MLFFLSFILYITNILADKSIPVHIGCYKTDFADDFAPGVQINQFSLESCLKFCEMKATWYAGVNVGTKKCYCSHSLAQNYKKLRQDACNFTCPHKNLSACGGKGAMSVYKLSEETTPVLLLASTEGVFRLHNQTLSRVFSLNFTNDISKHSTAPYIDYHYRKNEIFVREVQNIYRSQYSFECNCFMDPKVTVSSESPNFIDYMAVDWVKDHLYFSISNRIYRTNLDGQDRSEILSCQRLSGLAIDPYERKLFYHDFKGNLSVIQEFNLDTKEIRAIRNDVHITQLSIDIHAQTLYGKAETTVAKMNYDGSNYTYYYKTGFYINRISVYDENNLFFSHFERFTNMTFHLYEKGSPKLLATFGKNFYPELKVYDEVMQKPTNKSACASLACSHQCHYDLRTSTTHCVCPEKMELDSNRRNCKNIPDFDNYEYYKDYSKY